MGDYQFKEESKAMDVWPLAVAFFKGHGFALDNFEVKTKRNLIHIGREDDGSCWCSSASLKKKNEEQ